MVLLSYRHLPHLVVLAICLLLTGCTQKSENSGTPSGDGTKTSSATDTSEAVRPVRSGKPIRDMTAAEILELLVLHNRGVAHLENHEWSDAETALSELQARLPDDVNVSQNLAVARVLTLIHRGSPYSRNRDGEAYQKAVTRALESLADLSQLADTAERQAVAALLTGKLAASRDGADSPMIAEALAELQRAITLSGDHPAMWYAYVIAMDGHREYAESPELIRALKKTSTLVPENLFVIGKLLEKQALGLRSQNQATREESADIADTLRRMMTLLEPFNESIRAQRRVDLIDTISQALQKAESSGITSLLGPAMMARNLMLPELATQIDQRRIDLDLLEYLIVDLTSRLEPADSVRRELFPDAGETVITSFTSSNLFPEFSDVSYVRFADMNLDGRDDLIAVQSGRVRVYSRTEDTENEWTLIMESPEEAGFFSRCLLIDIDRDFDRTLSQVNNAAILRDADGDQRIVTDPAGKQRWFDTDLDVIAWSFDGVSVLRNVADDSGRRLELIPQSADVTQIHTVAAADLDADGDLDLIFGTATGLTLWKNIDGSTFEPVTSGLTLPDTPIVSLAIADWNRDMAMDVVGVTADGKTGWLQNMLHGRFRWLEGVDTVPGASNVSIAELNGDGIWDLFVSGHSGSATVIPANGERLNEASADLRSNVSASDHVRGDLDNDGYMDFVLSGPAGLTILRGKPDGSFEDLSHLLPDTPSCTGVTLTDLDDDGDLDIVIVTDDGHLQSFLNSGGDSNQWIEIVARAVGDDPQFPSNRVNMHGRGAVLEVRHGASWQAHVIDSPRMHIGLGKASSVNAIRVIWTDGVPQNITGTRQLRSRLGVLAPQILSGSCPYIYTWNGSRFEFFSDCLWAAPIGLVQATGDMAPTREWEYLLIPGEQLQPRDGKYVLQLTEELWEAAYFDEVRLLAVDHPADVDIFTNEKVGSPQMAAHRIHSVKDARAPKSVVDGTGRDLLADLLHQDQQYAQPFRGRILQGLTDEWTMEIDPGDLSSPGKPRPSDIRLVMIGWVFPTNTSLNQAILQNPSLQAPAPPSLQVINAGGEWETVIPFIGFPSGKTKAMVVDLSDAFLTDDYRIRICSSMELYWDRVFLIVNEDTADLQTRNCPLISADLHYRGFSRRTYSDQALFRNGHAPEGYDYDSVVTEPRWNEMLGRFTRYGDTTSLVREQDDLLVVMGPGDELTIEFEVPEADTPAGWKRDFILYNVGWDKDADLNTVYGQSSEPYPFQSMTRYPLAPEESAPGSPEYLRYLETYQTRVYRPFRFRSLLQKEAAAETLRAPDTTADQNGPL